MDKKRLGQASRRISDYIFGFGYNEPWKLVEGFYREFSPGETLKEHLESLVIDRRYDKAIKNAINLGQITCLCSLPETHGLAYLMLMIEGLRFGMHKLLRSEYNLEKLMAGERDKKHKYIPLRKIGEEYDFRRENHLWGDGTE